MMRSKWLLFLVLMGAGMAMVALMVEYARISSLEPKKMIGLLSETQATATPAPGELRVQVVSAPDNPIQTMLEKLFDPQVDLQARQSLGEKIDMAKLQATQQAAGELDRAPKKAPASLPAAAQKTVLQADFQEGLLEGSEGIIQPQEGVISNMWQGRIKSDYVQVFAGAEMSDLQQGLLIVRIISADRAKTQQMRFNPLQADGSLKIQSVNGGRVTLLLENGKGLVFNLSTLSFE